MKLKDIFIKKNIMPLIGLALTLFGLVMIIIAGDWANIVWPVIVLFLIFKGFKSTHNTMELRKQLDDVRKNRDEYMSQYKEYWEKYDAKVSENKILEEKFRNADSKIQGYRDMYNQADEQVKQLKEQLARYEQLEKPEPEPVVAAAAKEKTQEVKKTIDKVKKSKKK